MTLTLLPGTAWKDIEVQIRRLSDKELLKEYHTYLGLCAKSVTDIKLECMLEDELARRNKD